jgi:hypothetical protein
VIVRTNKGLIGVKERSAGSLDIMVRALHEGGGIVSTGSREVPLEARKIGVSWRYAGL